MRVTPIDPATVQAAYEISAEKNHDVYDCVYLAVARQADVDTSCTTDTDFESLCSNESVAYYNPVPRDVLEASHAFGSPGS